MKIYSISRGGRIVYVGQTNQTLEIRHSAHRTLKGWSFQESTIELLDEYNEKEQPYHDWEGFWIQQVRAWGFTLVNEQCYYRRPLIKPQHEIINDIIKEYRREQTTKTIAGRGPKCFRGLDQETCAKESQQLTINHPSCIKPSSICYRLVYGSLDRECNELRNRLMNLTRWFSVMYISFFSEFPRGVSTLWVYLKM